MVHLGFANFNSSLARRSHWCDNFRPCFTHGQANRYSFFRGGGLGGRPRTPKDSPLWGRPSGARPGKRRGGSGRQSRQWEDDRRFEEIESDEYDEDGQGGGLDRAFISDELRFTGEDLGRRRRRYEYSDSSGSSDERDISDDGDGANLQLALRDKEELLVQKALERIRRAQMLGKKNVKLTQPELDALERKRQKDQALKTQPKRRSSGLTLRGSDRRRDSNQLIGGTSKGSKPGKRTSKGYFPTYDGESSSNSRKGTSPGILVPGQAGIIGFSPLSHYPPKTIPSGSSSRPNSRTGSAHNLAQRSSPAPRSGNKRHTSGAETHQLQSAPRSPNTSRRLPDDPSWLPRPRSTSSVSGQSYPPDPFQYQTYSPPIPQLAPQYGHYSQGRRIVSSPQPDTHHPHVRGEAQGRLDPSLSRREQRPTNETDSESDPFSNDNEDDGVQVDVVPYGQGYSVNMRPENSNKQRNKRSGR